MKNANNKKSTIKEAALNIKEKIKNPFAARKFDPVPEIDVPDVSMYGMVKLSAAKHPDAPAFDYMGKKCTYAQMIAKIDECAKAYTAYGVKAGDVVTICMPNMPSAIFSIYALNKLGAICNIIHPLSAEQEIKRYVNSVESSILLVVDLCLKKIGSIIDETPLKHVITVCASESMPPMLKTVYDIAKHTKKTLKGYDSRFVMWDDFYAKAKTVGTVAEFKGSNDLPAIILHSGGTTGIPKEIVHSNRAFNSFGVQAVITLKDVSVGDVMLAILPIFHGFGLGVCIHVAFCYGACSVLIPRFDAKKFGGLLKKYKPTMIFGVPTLYEALINTRGIEKLDLSFLKYVVSGGDSLAAPLEKRINEFLAEHNAKVKISQGYGMTECLAAVCLAVGEGYAPGSIGLPLIGNKFCVVQPGTQTVLGPNEDGEICMSGPTIMLGYRNNEVETNDVLQIHEDGRLWLHSGDIGCIDETGKIFYKMRLKRMIVSSGYNVYPQNIEKTIEEHEAVLKCTVIGIPHPYKVEVAKAYIVLKNGFEATEKIKAEIKEHCQKNLARYSVPYEYEYRASLPKTLMGKTDFNQLKKEHMEQMKKEENINE